MLGLFYVMKICKKCGIGKSTDCFYKDKNRKDGLQPYCKECNKLYHKKYQAKNKEKLKEYNEKYHKSYYSKNKEKIKRYQEEWEKSNPNYHQEYKKRDYVKEKAKEYYQSNKDTILNRYKEYRKTSEHKERRRELEIIYKKENPHIYKWRHLLIAVIKRFNKTKESDTHHLLGYSAEELKNHLNNLNINWEIDHIDHKIPVAWFENETPPSVVCDLRNLQPLTPIQNAKKGNRYADEVDGDYRNIALRYIREEYKKLII